MKLSIIVWIIILTALLVWELWTVLDKKPHTLPLTIVTIENIPGIITMGFIGWLFVHFLIRYIKNGYWWWW